jgi:ABC-2 type transport system permease protein
MTTVPPRALGTWPAIRAMARQELRLAWRSRVVPALGAVMAALCLTAAVVSTARHRADASQRMRYQDVVGQQFASQPDRHPHRVSHYGYLVFRPRAPLGFLDPGIESFTGSSLFLEAHRQNLPTFSSASQGSSTERFGELSVSLVLQFLLPLFVLALAAVSITREREDGTLPLLSTQGASWPMLVWGKLLGQLLIVGVVLLPALVFCAAWLAADSATAWTPDLRQRMAALLATQLGLVVASAAIGVTVSARVATSRQALMAVLSLWFLVWVVLPRALPAAATAAHPTPARASFESDVEARVRELGDSHNPDDPSFRRLREETLARYGVSRVDELPFNYSGLVMREAEAHTSAAYQQHLSTLVDTYRRQERWVQWAGLVSPYLATRPLSMAIAGSDLAHQLEFERQAEAYRYTLIQALNSLHMNEVAAAADRYDGSFNGAPSRQRIDRAFFEDLPEFSYVGPDLRWAMAQQQIGVWCFVWMLVASLGALGITGRRRWQVRS